MKWRVNIDSYKAKQHGNYNGRQLYNTMFYFLNFQSNLEQIYLFILSSQRVYQLGSIISCFVQIVKNNPLKVLEPACNRAGILNLWQTGLSTKILFLFLFKFYFSIYQKQNIFPHDISWLWFHFLYFSQFLPVFFSIKIHSLPFNFLLENKQASKG